LLLLQNSGEAPQSTQGKEEKSTTKWGNLRLGMVAPASGWEGNFLTAGIGSTGFTKGGNLSSHLFEVWSGKVGKENVTCVWYWFNYVFLLGGGKIDAFADNPTDQLSHFGLTFGLGIGSFLEKSRFETTWSWGIGARAGFGYWGKHFSIIAEGLPGLKKGASILVTLGVHF
jgi:hypothetical protein